ncbi:MAG: (2Fe-2S)-binding protein [Sporomusaceae bacterium]|nr:(2Fe-2S)-binding protein [Sporomusaceae bacterium]
MRILRHPILGPLEEQPPVFIEVDGEPIPAREGEPIAAAIIAAGRLKLRHTRKSGEPRGVFCGIGRCTDCVMTVDGQANVRTCVTPVRAGMKIATQDAQAAREAKE